MTWTNTFELISQHTFWCIIWVNFLGYMFETPAVVLLTLVKCKRVRPDEWGKQSLISGRVSLVFLMGVIFTVTTVYVGISKEEK